MLIMYMLRRFFQMCASTRRKSSPERVDCMHVTEIDGFRWLHDKTPQSDSRRQTDNPRHEEPNVCPVCRWETRIFPDVALLQDRLCQLSFVSVLHKTYKFKLLNDSRRMVCVYSEKSSDCPGMQGNTRQTYTCKTSHSAYDTKTIRNLLGQNSRTRMTVFREY
ncbi:hypothetical protein K474DRAFT_1107865 [Panus rudis PR-1116 ss-1]|nr:hypothetical protein K474DRAFT_1107865 [Panus rudis PR-1116 ss-1]